MYQLDGQALEIGSTFDKGIAGSGGAISVQDGTYSVAWSVFSNHFAKYDGGAIQVLHSPLLEVFNCSFLVSEFYSFVKNLEWMGWQFGRSYYCRTKYTNDCKSILFLSEFCNRWFSHFPC